MQVDVPEIYQLEVTSRCNLNCAFCFRQLYKDRKFNDDLDVGLLKEMIRRGDFVGSWFVELQFRGEPLLYGPLAEVATLLSEKAKVLVGMSTNGFYLEERAEEVAMCFDYLTISTDAVEKEYECVRVGASWDKFIRGVEKLCSLLDSKKCKLKLVDIQVVQGEWLHSDPYQVREYFNTYLKKYPKLRFRTVNDCLIREKDEVVQNRFCFNPFTSVSVWADGTAVSCCYIFGPVLSNTYGSLVEKSLRELWYSEKAIKFRELFYGKNGTEFCRTCCKYPSPVLLHIEFMKELVKRIAY